MTDQPESGTADLFAFLDDDTLVIPRLIPSKSYPDGKIYTIPSPDAETGLRLTALADVAAKQQRGVKVSEADARKLQMNDTEEREFAEQVMGATYHEMMGDGVKWVTIQKVMNYAYIYFAMGQEVAEKAAREGLFTGGKARIPANRAERRAQARRMRGTR